MAIKTEIITIGDELLLGQTIDTNSAWMGQELNSIGCSVVQISSIQDEPQSIIDALDLAQNRADLIITTGGLGPTVDDLTKETLAKYFKTRLVNNAEVLRHIQELLGNRKVPMNQLNVDQAMLPEDCEILKNDAGTAAGMLFKRGDKTIVSLPGVPYEMKSICQNELFPWIQHNLKAEKNYFRMVMTTGYPESVLAANIEKWESELPEHCSVAYLPSPGIVKLRVSAKGKKESDLIADVNEQVNHLQKIIPDAIYSLENESMQETLHRILVNNNKWIGTLESCTGGAMAQLITSVPGSSGYFKGAIVSYSNELKSSIAKVDVNLIEKHGAVSEQVVRELARNALEVLSVDYAIASSGIAGPDGGTPEKPVGFVWLAVASKNQVRAHSFEFGNHRGRNIKRSSIAGLNMLRMLIEDEFQI